MVEEILRVERNALADTGELLEQLRYVLEHRKQMAREIKKMGNPDNTNIIEIQDYVDEQIKRILNIK